MEQSAFIKINPLDSVIVCLRPIAKGETISIDSFATQYKELAGTLHELFPEDSAEADIEPAGTENP